MKELVNLGSQFIRVCDETATLRGKALTLFALYTFLSCFYMLSYFSLPEAMRRAEERANDLETKLKASEEARKKAEKDDANVKYLRQRLQAVEDALSDKDAKQFERENNIVTRFETQSRRFSSNTFFPFFFCFSLFQLSLVLSTSCFSSSGKMGEQYTLSQESDDHLLDSLDILELNCDLARKCITSARNALKRVFPHFFLKDT
jgi:hypothetical protein